MARRIAWLVAATTSAVVVAFIVPLCFLVANLAEDRGTTRAREQAQSVATLVATVDDAATLSRTVADLSARGPEVVVVEPERAAARQPGRAGGRHGRRRRAGPHRAGGLHRRPGPRAGCRGAGRDRPWPRGGGRLGADVRAAGRGVGRLGDDRGAGTGAGRRSRSRWPSGSAGAPASPSRTSPWWRTGCGRATRPPARCRAGRRRPPSSGAHSTRSPTASTSSSTPSASTWPTSGTGCAPRSRRCGSTPTSWRTTTSPAGCAGTSADLQRSIDDVVHEARRSVRDELPGSTQVAPVVADRVAFWLPLAEDQGRRLDLVVELRTPGGPPWSVSRPTTSPSSSTPSSTTSSPTPLTARTPGWVSARGPTRWSSSSRTPARAWRSPTSGAATAPPGRPAWGWRSCTGSPTAPAGRSSSAPPPSAACASPCTCRWSVTRPIRARAEQGDAGR